MTLTKNLGYNPADYPAFAVTSDIALFTIRDQHLCILLVKRSEDPYAGQWALPGGFVGEDETTTEAAQRRLTQETHIPSSGGYIEQLGTYSDPDRDPRMRVVTVAHIGFIPDLPAPTGGSDVADAVWIPVGEALDQPLAFDHRSIILDALDRVRNKIEYTNLATRFVPEEFTLADLRKVYEIVWGTQLNPANFRRKVLNVERFVNPTGRETRNRSAGRPAATYTAVAATVTDGSNGEIMLNPPFRR